MNKAEELANALDKAPYSSACTNEAAAELRRLSAENAQLLKEVDDQCRLNGMGAERELALMAKLESAQRKLEAIYSTEPVAWVNFADEGKIRIWSTSPTMTEWSGLECGPLTPLPVRKS